MGIMEITTSIVTISIGGIAVIRAITEARKNFCSIIINIMLGGTLFTILNIMGVEMPLNLITAIIIVLLGVPGVGLILLVKMFFGIF